MQEIKNHNHLFDWFIDKDSKSYMILTSDQEYLVLYELMNLRNYLIHLSHLTKSKRQFYMEIVIIQNEKTFVKTLPDIDNKKNHICIGTKTIIIL